MKKTICMLLTALMILGLAACGSEKQEATTGEGFSPALDTATDCHITVAGGYDNFEALEAEFDSFNEYYPNVELTFTKVDDYNNMIGMVLDGNDAPDIYVNYSWMYGREQYQSSIDHAEDLSDPELGLDLDCIRSNIILNTSDGLSVPTTYQELVDVCNAFREKGYENPLMGFTKEETTSLYTLTAYPYFCETVANDAEAVKKLNALDASAGEYMRPTLEKMEQFMKDGCADPDACAAIEDNYEAVILRFFEGDVPMMTCSGDTVSGTKKRESRSEAFIANPFIYTFVPVPMSDDGANFLDMPNLQFSVNKDSGNLDMANEFMRFLITSQELNKMAQNKGLMSPTKDLSFNSMYAAFGDVPESRILSPEVIGLTDDAVKQVRQANYGVCTGAMTIDEAIAGYGTFTD